MDHYVFLTPLPQAEIWRLLESLQKQVAISELIFAECRSLKVEASILAVNAYDIVRHLQTENLFQRRRFAQSIYQVKARADAYIRPYDQAVRHANTAVEAMGHRPMLGYLCLEDLLLDNRLYLSGVDWLADIESMLDVVICAVEKHEYRLGELQSLLSGY